MLMGPIDRGMQLPVKRLAVYPRVKPRAARCQVISLQRVKQTDIHGIHIDLSYLFHDYARIRECQMLKRHAKRERSALRYRIIRNSR